MSTLHPEISIVIVNYNSGEFLAGTLQSILDNPPSSEWEVIIFDNASTDNSLEHAKSIIRDNPRFGFITSNENFGFAGANNRAVKETRGEYILLLNPDTGLTPNAVDNLYLYLKNHDDVAAVGPHLVDSDNSSTVSFGYFPTITGIIAGAFLPRRFQVAKSGTLGIIPDPSITRELDVGYVSGACLMTKRAVWEESGGLDESFFAYFEETDWCLRLHKKGLRSVFIPYVTVRHFEGKSFSGIPYRHMEIFVRSAMRFFNRHFPPAFKYLYVFSNIFASAIKIIYYTFAVWIGGDSRRHAKSALAHHKAFLKALIKYGR
jgi:GT2 family glycosyltransferase